MVLLLLVDFAAIYATPAGGGGALKSQRNRIRTTFPPKLPSFGPACLLPIIPQQQLAKYVRVFTISRFITPRTLKEQHIIH